VHFVHDFVEQMLTVLSNDRYVFAMVVIVFFFIFCNIALSCWSTSRTRTVHHLLFLTTFKISVKTVLFSAPPKARLGTCEVHKSILGVDSVSHDVS